MALKNYYCGEDINFTFRRLISGTVDQFRNLDNYTDIFIYVSNRDQVIKFSKNAKTGYTTLERVDAYNYRVKLSSANTRTLGRGTVKISTNMVSSDLTIEDLRFNRLAGGTAFVLLYELIGEEN